VEPRIDAKRHHKLVGIRSIADSSEHMDVIGRAIRRCSGSEKIFA
jgi:hypothetical protein